MKVHVYIDNLNTPSYQATEETICFEVRLSGCPVVQHQVEGGYRFVLLVPKKRYFISSVVTHVNFNGETVVFLASNEDEEGNALAALDKLMEPAK